MTTYIHIEDEDALYDEDDCYDEYAENDGYTVTEITLRAVTANGTTGVHTTDVPEKVWEIDGTLGALNALLTELALPHVRNAGHGNDAVHVEGSELTIYRYIY